ncbi:DUF2382 domain-containing protein [Nocardia yunnanensis]|uniref:DUF2382 domain-containing protein n=1 Tax=Nocardia yunnanensis TaxID=2382165 RepID=A0A386ZH08_9NOCA|nr:DUF2382 domain-containing protein [Nocardia yunnanensis]AYF76483.1 DUF2382 domain-containing protein [Nocardia yunnanensis]
MANPTLEALIGATVYDSADEAIGRVENFYLDNETGTPTWVAMAGDGSRGPTLIPLDGAGYRTEDMSLRVPYAKDQISSAPHLEHDGKIDSQSEQQLLAHYRSGQRRGTGTAAMNIAGRQRVQPGPDEPMTYGKRDPGLTRSEERLVVDTDRVETGTARLHKYVVEEEQTITVPTSHEEVRVVREPITDRTAADAVIGEDAQEVVLHADRVTAHKETVPVERVGLAVDEVADEQSVSDTVRKERVETEGLDAMGQDAMGRSSMGRDAMGREPMGRDAMGRDRDRMRRENDDRA